MHSDLFNQSYKPENTYLLFANNEKITLAEMKEMIIQKLVKESTESFKYSLEGFEPIKKAMLEKSNEFFTSLAEDVFRGMVTDESLEEFLAEYFKPSELIPGLYTAKKPFGL